MKAFYKAPDGTLTVEVQAETVKDLFRQVAQLEMAFGVDPACKLCHNGIGRRNYRVTGDQYAWFELVCGNCGGVLTFGQHKTGGTLYPKKWAARPESHRGEED